MSNGIDVEALLESLADGIDPEKANDNADRRDPHRSDRRERDRERERGSSRDRHGDRKRRDRDGDADMESSRTGRRGSVDSENRPQNGTRHSHKGNRSRTPNGSRYSGKDGSTSPGHGSTAGRDRRRRSRSRSRDRRRGDGDSRYRQPPGRGDYARADRRYRDRSRERGDRPSEGGRRRSRSPRRAKTPEPQLTEDERDRRTIFVQQLAARLRSSQLAEFFSKIGPVKDAQIVKDRVSGRSKGVGYVEFKNEESVQPAIQLTGQKLLGIPIIAQLTEAEKNRQARNPEAGSNGNTNSIPFHRLYVGNIHFSITESDLQNVFEPFGELEFVQLQKEEMGRSRGYGFVQFRDPTQAREALEKMNGFELAGRPIRVGLGNDKFTPESTANLLQRFQGQSHTYQGSAFSGSGGRGAQAGGGGGSFDRAGGRDNDRGAGGASALDDTDVAGVNFSNYSRDALMRKLARTDDPNEKNGDSARKAAQAQKAKALPIEVSAASRCVVLRNMFNPAEETSDNWVKELEEDVRGECEAKYGHVVHIAVDPNTQGDIYVKFDRVQGGENAIKGLNGRYFGGRMISAQPMVDAVYGSLFQRAKAL